MGLLFRRSFRFMPGWRSRWLARGLRCARNSGAKLLALFALSTAVVPLAAQASEWQFAGGAKGENNAQLILFFDADSITRPTTQSVRFWVKGIRVINGHRYQDAHRNPLVEQAARSVAKGYAPGLLLLSPVRAQYPTIEAFREAVIDAIIWEIIANEASVSAASKFYFDIDCRGRRVRTLQGELYDESGNIRTSHRPLNKDYEFISPDSNVERWSMMLCSSK